MDARMQEEVSCKIEKCREEREAKKQLLKAERRQVNDILRDHGVQLFYDKIMDREISCAIELISDDTVKVYVTICSERDQWGRPKAREQLVDKILNGDPGYVFAGVPEFFTRVDKNDRRQLSGKGFRRIVNAVKCSIGVDACLCKRQVPHVVYQDMRRDQSLWLDWVK